VTAAARGPRALGLALLLYAALLGAGMARHELWRDETQAWSVARSSTSPYQLATVEMRYEGHPAAWYLLLWPVTRVTGDPRAMQLVHALVAIALAALWLTCAPFPTWTRLLLLFGYFPLYEWGVLSRNYSLGLLALFAALAVWPRRRERPLALGALLALAANSNLYALLLAAAFGGALALEQARAWRRGRASGKDLRAAALALGIALCGALVALATLWPPEDRWSGRTPKVGLRPLVGAAASAWEGWVPLPDPGSLRPWNTNLLEFEPEPASHALRAGLGLALILAGMVSLRRRPLALAFFGLSSGLLFLVTMILWHGFLRHHGHFFWCYVAALWLAAHEGRAGEERPDPGWSVAPGRIAPALLLVAGLAHGLAGAWLYGLDLARPFSEARAAAAWLRVTAPGLPIVASRDYLCSPVAAYLDRPLYYPELGAWGTYWLAKRRPQRHDAGFALEAARGLANTGRGPVLLLLSEPLPDTALAGGEIERARFDRGMIGYRDRFSNLEPEDYRVYEIAPPGR
jgi:hypothetical protein